MTTQYQLLPADAQRSFAGRMGATVTATVTEIEASRADLVSQAEAVADVIGSAAN